MTGVSRVSDRVPVAPLREAFEQSGMSSKELARRLYGDPRRCTNVQRMLGIKPCWSRTTSTYSVWAARIGYEHALRIAEAIGVDPVDVGL